MGVLRAGFGDTGSNAGGGDNLHRNVIYRDGKADRVLPLTTFQRENPEDL